MYVSRTLERVRAVLLGQRHTPTVQAPQLQPRAEWFPAGPWEHAMVRPYVASLGDVPRTARTGTHADPWRDAR